MKKYKTPILLLVAGIISVVISGIANYYNKGSWFARSGSILTFTSILSGFILTNIKRKEIISILESSIDKKEKVRIVRKRDVAYKSVQYIAFSLGLVGTII